MMAEQDKNRDIRILVADDMAPMRNVIRSMLRNLGYRNAAIAENGLEAWEILKKEEIDLVISDWDMPEMNGIELLDTVRSTTRYEDMPFIMVTGEIAEENVAQAAETDVDAYLLKPFNLKRLSELIESVMELKNNPSSYQQLINAGREFTRNGQYEEALAVLTEALEEDAEKPLAYLSLGALFNARGDYPEAKEAYQKVLSRNSRHIKALHGLAEVYSKEGDVRNLFESLKVLVNLSPRNIGRQMKLAGLAVKFQDKALCRSCCNKVISLEPENDTLIMQIGKLFLENDMLEDAERIFADYSAKYPHNVGFLSHLAEIYRKNGMHSRARDNYLKVLEMVEDKAEIHYKLAQVYIDSGIKRLARSHLESAILMNPDLMAAEQALDRLDELVQRAEERKKEAR